MKKIIIFLIFLLGVLLRFLLLSAKANQIGGATATTALVARHILLKNALPLSYPMVHYGDILRAYIGALMFKMLGVSISTFYIGIILFYSLPAVIFVYFLSKKVSKNQNVAILSMLFMSLAPAVVNFLLLHQLALCLVPMILLLVYLISFEGPTMTIFKKGCFYSILGLLTGIGLWNDAIILPYIIWGIIFLYIKDKHIHFKCNFSLFLFFCIIGCLPYIIYNIIHPLASVMRFGSYILNVDRSVLQQDRPVCILLRKVLEKILYIPKAMPKALLTLGTSLGTDKKTLGTLAWLGLPAIGIYIVSFLHVLYTRRKIFLDLFQFRLKGNQLNGVDLLLFAVIFTYLSAAITGFYNSWWRMTPFYPILIIFVSIFLCWCWQRFKIIAIFLIILFLGINLTGIPIALKQPIPSYDTLISFLEATNISAGYSNDDIGFMVTFDSDEKIIILPTASMEDIGFVEYGLEWPEHRQAVESAENICYIFDIQEHLSQIQIMHKRLKEIGISYENKLVYPFLIFYNFSKKPHPEKLDLPALRTVNPLQTVDYR